MKSKEQTLSFTIADEISQYHILIHVEYVTYLFIINYNNNTYK